MSDTSDLHVEIDRVKRFLEYQREQLNLIRTLIIMLERHDRYLMLTSSRLKDTDTKGINKMKRKVQAANEKLLSYFKEDGPAMLIALLKWASVRNSYVIGGTVLIFELIVSLFVVFKNNLKVNDVIAEVNSILKDLQASTDVNLGNYDTTANSEYSVLKHGNDLYSALLQMRDELDAQIDSDSPVVWISKDNAKYMLDVVNQMEMDLAATIVSINILKEYKNRENEFVARLENKPVGDVDDENPVENFETRGINILYDLEGGVKDFDNRLAIYDNSLIETAYKLHCEDRKKLEEKSNLPCDEKKVLYDKHVDNLVNNKKDNLLSSIKTVVLNNGREVGNEDMGFTVDADVKQEPSTKKEALEDTVEYLTKHLNKLQALQSEHHEEDSDDDDNYCGYESDDPDKKIATEIKLTKKLIGEKVAEMAKLGSVAEQDTLGRIGLRFSNEKLYNMIEGENKLYFDKKKLHDLSSKIHSLMLHEMNTNKFTTTTFKKTMTELHSIFLNEAFAEISPWVYGKLTFWYVAISVLLDLMISKKFFTGRQLLTIRLLFGTLSRYAMTPTWVHYETLGDVDELLCIRSKTTYDPKRDNPTSVEKANTTKNQDDFKTYVVFPEIKQAIKQHFSQLDDFGPVITVMNSLDSKLTDKEKFLTVLFTLILSRRYRVPSNKLSIQQFKELIRINNPTNMSESLMIDKDRDAKRLWEMSQNDVKSRDDVVKYAIELAKAMDYKKIIDLKNNIAYDTRKFIREIKGATPLVDKKIVDAVKKLDKDMVDGIVREIASFGHKNIRVQAVVFITTIVYLSMWGTRKLTKQEFSDFIRLHDPDDKESFLKDKSKTAPKLFELTEKIESVEEKRRPTKIVRYCNFIVPNIDLDKIVK